MLRSFVTNKFLITGFMLYGLGAIVWLGVLAKWDVSKAYPLVGLGFLLSALVVDAIQARLAAGPAKPAPWASAQ